MKPKNIRCAAIVALLLLLIVLAFEGWRLFADRGVSHRDLEKAVVRESAAVRERVDARCDALERRLDRIESKIDRLIDMATPKLPDGMKVAE